MFFLIFFMLLEFLRPKRIKTFGHIQRWPHNLFLIFFNTLVMRMLFPGGLVVIVLWIDQRGIGLFNLFGLNPLIEILLSIVILDFFVWANHVLFHRVSFLWKIHEMHHVDLDLDVTSGIRFHPIEILISYGVKMLAILIFGLPVMGVLIFEIVLNATAMFNHSNLDIPCKLDRFMRIFIVTPDMHRVHHSIDKRETNSNYGFNLPVWDYVFKTYRAAPQMGHKEMIIGTENFRNIQYQQFFYLLIIPFMKRTSQSVSKNSKIH